MSYFQGTTEAMGLTTEEAAGVIKSADPTTHTVPIAGSSSFPLVAIVVAVGGFLAYRHFKKKGT